MFEGFYESLLNQISLIKITDLIDIFIVTFILYKALKFIRDTRTVHLLKGVIVLIVAMQVSQFAKLHTVNYLLSNALQLGMIAIIIVFQPELRRALEQLGRTTMGQWFNFEDRTDDIEKEKIPYAHLSPVFLYCSTIVEFLQLFCEKFLLSDDYNKSIIKKECTYETNFRTLSRAIL